MKIKMMSRLVAALAFVLLAAACSTPQQTTGLQITDFTPERDAVDVAVDTTVSVTFNEALDDETIANGITVVGGGAIRAGEVEYDAATRTLTFTPDTPLAYSTNYLASVPTSVRSATGSSLAAPVAWTFRTAAAPAGAIVGVIVTPATATLQLGGQEAVPLTATVEATGDAPETVTWTSNEQSVATVNSAGVVTAVAPGTATITATSTFDSTKSGSAVITVEAATNGPAPSIVGVSVAPATATVAVGGSQQLTATVEAVGGATETVTWTSSAAAIATVNSAGLVTAVSIGSATITATSTFDTSKSGTAVITVTATVVPPAIVGVSVDPDAATVVAGETQQLSATVDAVGGADESVGWTSDDLSVATVDSAGLVTAVSPGTATITATSTVDETKSGSSEITVTPAPAIIGVTVDPDAATVDEGETQQLSATVETVGGASETVDWTSSDETVATVDVDGLVTAVSAGTATITATSDFDGTKSASAEITVVAALSLAYPDSPYAYDAGANITIDPVVENASPTGTLSFEWEPVHELNESLWSIDPTTGQITRVMGNTQTNLLPNRNGNRTYTVTVTEDGPEGVRTATFDVVFEQNP